MSSDNTNVYVWGFRNADDALMAHRMNLANVILSCILIVALPLSLMLMAKKSQVTFRGTMYSSKTANQLGLVLLIVAFLHIAAIICLTAYIQFKLLTKIYVNSA